MDVRYTNHTQVTKQSDGCSCSHAHHAFAYIREVAPIVQLSYEVNEVSQIGYEVSEIGYSTFLMNFVS
jgi:hypothetical protein